MPRPQLHDTDAILDAARDLLLSEGARRVTVEAIAEASGAPTGTLYHRFGSRDELVAQLWIRAARRSQARFLAALETDSPEQAAVAAALSILDFCRAEPADALLLASFRREDLLRRTPTGELADQLAVLNKPIERAVTTLARRLYGRATRPAIQRTLLAVLDLPYGAVRRYLTAGEAVPAGLRKQVDRAVNAVLHED